MPNWVNREDVFADVLVDILDALRSYDPNLGKLTTYLYRVVQRAAMRTMDSQRGKLAMEDVNPNLLLDGSVEPCDIVDTIATIFGKIPDDEINEQTRQLVAMLLKGYSQSDIACKMEWSRSYTAEMVQAVRNHIAWRLVDAGYSGEPWITDSDLAEMAEAHEKSLRWNYWS
jgi:DNA-directed RNA polymerase specialized sigma24 family protein